MANDDNDKADPTDIRTKNVSRESLTGSPARSVHAEVVSVTRETLVKGPGVYGVESWRETLVDVPDEPTSLERIVTSAAQTAAGRRETPNPASVYSWTQTGSLSALCTFQTNIPWARSQVQYRTAVLTAASERDTLDPDDLRSPIEAKTQTWLTSLSRNRAYIPVSAVYAKGHVSLVAAERTDADPISATAVTSSVSLVAQSRVAWIDTASAQAAALAQLVAKLRVPVAPYSAPHVASHVSLVAARRQTPEPFADSDAAQVFQQVTAERTDADPISATSAAAHVALATQQRDTETPTSPLEVSQHVAAVTVERDATDTPTSPLMVAQGRTLVAAHRKTEPPTGYQVAALKTLAAAMRGDNAFPLSQAIVTLSIQQAAAPKTVPAIEDVWSASPVAQAYTQAAIGRWTIHPDLVVDPTLGHHVQIIKVQYALGRIVPSPTDVYDPETGRLVRGAFSLAALRRQTSVVVSRTVFGLTQSVLLPDDTFPPQAAITADLVTQPVALGDDTLPPGDAAVSEASVSEAHAHTALGDTDLPAGTDPLSDVSVSETHAAPILGDTAMPAGTDPLSDVATDEVIGQAALGDTAMPAGTDPLSDALVEGVHADAALGDTTFPDTDQALSDALVESTMGVVALGDTTLPDANIPLSEVDVQALAQSIAAYDQVQANANPVSDTSTHNVIQAVVLRDPNLRRIPSRPAGPRPVISISIH